MQQQHHRVLFRKRQLEIISLILNVSIILGLFIAVIILSVQLKKARHKECTNNTNCDECQYCANGVSSTGNELKICCPKGDTVPFINTEGSGSAVCTKYS